MALALTTFGFYAALLAIGLVVGLVVGWLIGRSRWVPYFLTASLVSLFLSVPAVRVVLKLFGEEQLIAEINSPGIYEFLALLVGVAALLGLFHIQRMSTSLKNADALTAEECISLCYKKLSDVPKDAIDSVVSGTAGFWRRQRVRGYLQRLPVKSIQDPTPSPRSADTADKVTALGAHVSAMRHSYKQIQSDAELVRERASESLQALDNI